MHPQPSGPRCIFEDAQHNTYLFSPVTDQLLGLPGYEGSLGGVLWDTQDPHSFLVTNGAAMHLYKFLPMTVTGPRVLLVNKTPQPASHTPVAVTLGVVTCRWVGRTADSADCLKGGSMTWWKGEVCDMLGPPAGVPAAGAGVVVGTVRGLCGRLQRRLTAMHLQQES